MRDFGCGDDTSVKYMREIFPNANLFGTDVSEKSVEETEQKEIPGAKFISYDGKTLPYGDNSMDIIFTPMVFHYINFERHDA
jgi:trans-aconitate methyltransferase